MRAALIVCTDHELNASSFTARCIASTGAGIGAAVPGGVSALSGRLHGRFSDHVEAFFDELRARPSFDRGLLARLGHGDIIPGFGHPLYPEGGLRAHSMKKRRQPDESSALHPDDQGFSAFTFTHTKEKTWASN